MKTHHNARTKYNSTSQKQPSKEKHVWNEDRTGDHKPAVGRVDGMQHRKTERQRRIKEKTGSAKQVWNEGKNRTTQASTQTQAQTQTPAHKHKHKHKDRGE